MSKQQARFRPVDQNGAVSERHRKVERSAFFCTAGDLATGIL
jgi:hypothetical protein